MRHHRPPKSEKAKPGVWVFTGIGQAVDAATFSCRIHAAHQIPGLKSPRRGSPAEFGTLKAAAALRAVGLSCSELSVAKSALWRRVEETLNCWVARDSEWLPAFTRR